MTVVRPKISPELEALLRQKAEADGPRVEKARVLEQVFWIKRPEALSLRMRLQKGHPQTAFEAEIAAHTECFDQGLPVAPLVLVADRYFITEDCGPSLKHIAHRTPEKFREALRAGAKALAGLHAAGVSHGRPSLKDLCWKDEQIAFLDFERAGRGSVAQDIQILMFSTAVETRGNLDAMALARDAYIAAGGADTWRAACVRARYLAWPSVLLRPVVWCLPKNAEFQAIGPFFRFMAQPL